jgi:hypothetical protein
MLSIAMGGEGREGTAGSIRVYATCEDSRVSLSSNPTPRPWLPSAKARFL